LKVFFDSSSFAKRFSNESGSNDVDEICAQASEIILSVLVLPEIISALTRKNREGVLSEKLYAIAKAQLLKEANDAILMEIDSSVLMNAIDLLERFQVRTLDAIHIASAIESKADLFVTSDKKQYEAAFKSGIPVKLI